MQCIYHYAEITAENNVYKQTKIYVVHMSQGSIGYRSMSAARSWPQQQTRRPALLLWISGTEERTVDRFTTLGIERHVDCVMCLSWVVKWMPVFFSYSVIVVYIRVQGIWGAAFVKVNISWCRYRKSSRLHKYPILEVVIYLLHTHPFNAPFSGTTQVSRYQDGKTNLDFTEARDSERQWHQLGHMQVCTSLQTDNHTSTPPLSFYRPGALPAAQPTASKHWRHLLQYTANICMKIYWTFPICFLVFICVCVISHICTAGINVLLSESSESILFCNMCWHSSALQSYDHNISHV